ncbi:MAG: DUF2284 domain-containing protein [Clostridia bacterium]|nr:DUF2284 domain-containing protein [Clostridia bacterium]
MAEIRWEEKIEKALSLGAFRAAVIGADAVVTDAAFRDICASNRCGLYGKCWMCPPDIGEIDEVMATLQTYTRVLVYQKVYPLDDSFDMEGIRDAKKDFTKLIQSVKKAYPDPSMLHLGAGGCGLCRVCAKRDDLPCRHPDRAVASLEGYGINVSALAASAGMKYVNGQNTVTYFGAVFF